jgi:hypothetical protein
LYQAATRGGPELVGLEALWPEHASAALSVSRWRSGPAQSAIGPRGTGGLTARGRKPPKPAAVAEKASMDTFHFGKPSETAHSADCASAINPGPEVPSAPVLRRRWHGRSAWRMPHRGFPETTQSPPHGHGRPRPEPPSGQEWAQVPGACSLRRRSAPPIPGSAPRMFSSASSFYRRRRLLHCRSGVPLPGHSRDACTAPPCHSRSQR